MNRVIFGGGFDPIHLGHLNMAVKARDALNAEVIFVPAKVSVWKEESISPEHKLNMIKLAIEDYQGLVVDTFELDSKEQPFSYETVSYFRKKYPKDQLYLLIGQDQVNSFHLWQKPEEIAKMAQIVYFKRPKYDLNMQNVEIYRIIGIEGNEIDVSSSDVRSLKSVAVPEKVLKYIEDNSIYFINKVKSYINDKRYEHSLSVAHLAYKIAKIHHLDAQKAYIAGLLHDIAKSLDKAEALTLMKKYYPDYVNIGAYAYHQFLGEMVASNDFNIKDIDILNAIKYHTTGRKGMSTLEKLIYACDKIEPTRQYDSTDLINAMKEDVNSGFVTVLQANMEFLGRMNKTIDNRLTEECVKYYLG